MSSHPQWLTAVTGFGRRLARGFADLLYPPTCLICAASLPADVDHFCVPCRDHLSSDDAPRCPRCAASVGPYSNLDGGCSRCRDERFAFDAVVRLGLYDGLLRDAILKMKHHTGEGLAECLGEFWATHAETALRNLKADAIVPIPLHWRRRLKRGYNQADSIAFALAAKLRWPCRPGLLRRVRNTPIQPRQELSARAANVKGAFQARPHRDLKDKTILLVDDVMTTGSTVGEAAKALRQAGAARVVVAVLARASG